MIRIVQSSLFFFLKKDFLFKGWCRRDLLRDRFAPGDFVSTDLQQAVDEPGLLRLLTLPPQGDGGMPHGSSLHFYHYISQFKSFSKAYPL